jgi:hypothetical protein
MIDFRAWRTSESGTLRLLVVKRKRKRLVRRAGYWFGIGYPHEYRVSLMSFTHKTTRRQIGLQTKQQTLRILYGQSAPCQSCGTSQEIKAEARCVLGFSEKGGGLCRRPGTVRHGSFEVKESGKGSLAEETLTKGGRASSNHGWMCLLVGDGQLGPEELWVHGTWWEAVRRPGRTDHDTRQ